MDTKTRIFDLLDKQGIEQKSFAAEVGVSEDTVSNWRRGVSKSYSRYLVQIAQVLGTTTADLLGEKQQSSPPAKDELQRLSPAERELLQAYRKADTRAREIVHLTLQPFGLPSSSDEEKAV